MSENEMLHRKTSQATRPKTTFKIIHAMCTSGRVKAQKPALQANLLRDLNWGATPQTSCDLHARDELHVGRMAARSAKRQPLRPSTPSRKKLERVLGGQVKSKLLSHRDMPLLTENIHTRTHPQKHYLMSDRSTHSSKDSKILTITPLCPFLPKMRMIPTPPTRPVTSDNTHTTVEVTCFFKLNRMPCRSGAPQEAPSG